jgi:hypothetical protein
MIAREFNDGYVYYIRFKTPKGIFYKIGFTTMDSVELRFSYGGSENYKMIDKVFMYKYSLDAYEYEQLLHSNLRADRAYKGYGLATLFSHPSEHPLFRNGQSELYREDVLGLDPEYKRPFSFGNIFKAQRSDIVAKRQLQMNWLPYVRERMEARTYEVLDAFLQEPLFFSREEFMSREGEWVLPLYRWASKNAMTGDLLEGTTVHGHKPLPQTKAELLALETFAPGWCYITSIPPEIAHLINLKTIRVRSDEVKVIPDEVYTLSKLTELNLANTGTQSLSSGIANLRALEILDLRYCDQLEYLPPEVEQLPSLKEVRILKKQFDRLVKYFPTKPELLVYDDHGWD